MKECTKCHQLKPFDGFNKDKYNPTGYKSHCKECMKKDRNTDKYREYSRKAAAKWRATEKGKEYQKITNSSDKQKARKRAWKQTEAGKLSNQKYNRSEAKRINAKKQRETNPKWKEYRKRGDKKYRENPEHKPKIRARKTIWKAIKAGKIPRANTLNCSYCSNQAEHYHHHNGYESRLDVIPVCRTCHEGLHHS